LICGGIRIKADEAFRLGIINKVVREDLLVHAIALARELGGQKSRVSDLAAPKADLEDIELASNKALKAGKARPQIKMAIEMIMNAMTMPIDQGLAKEREVFQELRISTEAKALRHQFFAERKLFKALSLNEVQAKVLERIAVIGAGTMGSGIAIACLSAGYSVHMLDQSATSLANGVKKIEDFYGSRLINGKMSTEKVAAALGRFTHSSQWGDIASADLIIEAVFEDLEVKHAVFKQIDEHAKADALLATNTSYLDIEVIAEKTRNPARLFGLHFFSPANVMKLIEIVRCKASSDAVIATGLLFAKRLGKTPVISANAFGFIGNRIYAAYRRQCEFMLEEGASPEQIDKALEDFGFAMGPFAVADMSGLDIAWAMRKNQAATRGPAHRYVSIPDTLCLAGRFGRKTGSGYYSYDAAGKRSIDPWVHQVIAAASATKNITRREFTSQEIVNRVLLTMMNEVAHLVSERVVGDATDCDIALVNGYGFPRWQGGPVFMAREMGLDKLNADIDVLEKQSGPGFKRANLNGLFE
jgi:3-hydroxyacyl-CoA dehydrogenase